MSVVLIASQLSINMLVVLCHLWCSGRRVYDCCAPTATVQLAQAHSAMHCERAVTKRTILYAGIVWKSAQHWKLTD